MKSNVRAAVPGTIPGSAGTDWHGTHPRGTRPCRARAFQKISYSIPSQSIFRSLQRPISCTENTSSRVIVARSVTVPLVSNVLTTALAPPELPGSVAMVNNRLSLAIALGDRTTLVTPIQLQVLHAVPEICRERLERKQLQRGPSLGEIDREQTNMSADVDNDIALLKAHVPQTIVIRLQLPGDPGRRLRAGFVVRHQRDVIDLVMVKCSHRGRAHVRDVERTSHLHIPRTSTGS